MITFQCATRALSVLAVTLLTAFPSYGDMRLDKVIVDFDDGKTRRTDIEVTNHGKSPIYVSAKPAEILRPGLKNQERRQYRDPKEMGMLVSPTRLVLEPGQSKTVRLSLLEPPQGRDRIYRVKIAPVVGRTVALKSGLRIVVGYDVLVIARPDNAKSEITGERNGRRLTLRNTGNTNALLLSGKQCDEAGKCVDLPTARLYAGATWTVDLPLDAPARYQLRTGEDVRTQTF